MEAELCFEKEIIVKKQIDVDFYVKQSGLLVDNPIYLVQREQGGTPRVCEFRHRTRSYEYVLSVPSDGLPTKHDVVVQYYVLGRLQQLQREKHDDSIREIELDIAEIRKGCGIKSDGGDKIRRIREALRRYERVHATVTKLSPVKDEPAERRFSIIDKVVFYGPQKRRVRVRFCDEYLSEISSEGQKRYFAMEHLASLSPLAFRFFELVNNMMFAKKKRVVSPFEFWGAIVGDEVASTTTPSHIKSRLKAAAEDIKKKTGVCIKVETIGYGKNAKLELIRTTQLPSPRNLLPAKAKVDALLHYPDVYVLVPPKLRKAATSEGWAALYGFLTKHKAKMTSEVIAYAAKKGRSFWPFLMSIITDDEFDPESIAPKKKKAKKTANSEESYISKKDLRKVEVLLRMEGEQGVRRFCEGKEGLDADVVLKLLSA